ncbi:MAG: hypothetical protein N2556_07785, partial [Anaerolineae bacterium]|nr:hypothetical protein [Anaerolineae bacterium]
MKTTNLNQSAILFLALLAGIAWLGASLWAFSDWATPVQAQETLPPRLWLPLVMRNAGPGPSPTPSPTSTPTPPGTATYSLRFYGTGSGDIDRVKIPIRSAHGASLPVNVGATDFTIEFWVRFAPG